MRGKYWSLAAVLAAACTLSSCSLLPEQEIVRTAPVISEYQKEAYEMTLVERGDIVETGRVSAAYVPVQKEALAFEITGEYVDRMLVQVGDEVQAGQLLGQQRVDDIEEAIRLSEDAVRELELKLEHEDALHALELERVQLRHEKDGRQALEEAIRQAEEDYAAARRVTEDALTVEQVRLEGLKQELDKRQLRAPFSGTVTYVREYEEGHKSGFAETAVTVADSTVTLFRAETKLWPLFAPGDPHEIEVDGEVLPLVVASEEDLGLEPQEKIEDKKAYVYFKLIETNPVLESGAYGAIYLEIDRRDDVLHVPQSAVMEAGDKHLVYYENEDGIKAYKKVQIGATLGKRTEILSGLTEGEKIIAG